jgi:hypothetical protein
MSDNRGQHGQGQSNESGQWQNMSRDMFGQQNPNQSQNRENRGGGDEVGLGRPGRPAALGAPSAARAFGPARAAYAETGRLDVTA